MKGWISPDFASASSAPAHRRSSRSRSLPNRHRADGIPAYRDLFRAGLEHEADTGYRTAIKADYPALRAKARARPTGFYFPFNMKPALEAAPEERARLYEEAWQRGGLPFLGAFGDLLFEKAANDTIADFARDKIRAIVRDPATADCCAPTMCSAASGSASIPDISRPIICRM